MTSSFSLENCYSTRLDISTTRACFVVSKQERSQAESHLIPALVAPLEAPRRLVDFIFISIAHTNVVFYIQSQL